MLRAVLAQLVLVAVVSGAEAQAVAVLAPYAAARPRLLLDGAAVPTLVERARRRPDQWQPVIAAAKRLIGAVPDAKVVREGKTYYRIDGILAASLAYLVSREPDYRDGSIAWMRAHAVADVWGTGWRENVDIPANWYMYYIALGYDLLHQDIPEADRRVIAEGLGRHAEAVYQSWKKETTFPYDQNHTYVPMVGLAAAALALVGEDPRAEGWLACAAGIMGRCREVLPADGWYYEGTGYWEYAFHWHLRYADLISRATGQAAYELPMFRENHLFAAHLSLPGAPFAFDIGDTGKGAGRRSLKPRFGRMGALFGLAAAFRNPGIQGVAEGLLARGGDWDDPGMQFLWCDPGVASIPMTVLPTAHCFQDAGVITWRSGWDADATIAMFRCGPPLGYAAQAKLERMPEWRPNTGHVHPDIGMFWLYARGAYLATDTGYSGRKRTRDHNTILVDGQGMGADFNFWVYSGFPQRDIPYATWTGAKLVNVRLEPAYAYAMADFSGVYGIPGLRIHRHFLASRDAIVVLDDLGGDKPHVFTSLVHADNVFTEVAPGVHRSDAGSARLLHYVLNPADCTIATASAEVFSFVKPNEGKDEQRGYQLTLTSPQPTVRQRFLSVLVPVAAREAEPLGVEQAARDEDRVQVRIRHAAGPMTSITIDVRQGAATLE